MWVQIVSGDRGEIWYRMPSGISVRLTAPGVTNATRPAVATNATGDLVVVAWRSHDPSSQSLRSRRSTDGGVSWGPESVIWQDPLTYLMTYPSLEFGTGETLHIAWSHYFDGSINIWYRRSNDGGASWQNRHLLWSGSADSGDEYEPGDRGPVLAAGSTGRVDVAWVYYEMTDHNSLYAISSADEGTTWPSPQQAAQLAGPGFLTEPTIETDNRGLSYVLWEEVVHGTPRVISRRSPNLAAGWLPPDTLKPWHTYHKGKPRVAVDDLSTLHLLKLDHTTGVPYSHWGLQMLSNHAGATAFNQQRRITTTTDWFTGAKKMGITYEDNGVIYYLRTTNTGSSWSPPESVGPGEYPALVVQEGSGSPRIAYLKDGQDIMLAVPSLGGWQHYTVFEGNLPYVRPGPPAACYSSWFHNGTVRVAYSVHEHLGEFGPPTHNHIYLSEIVPGYPPVTQVLHTSTLELSRSPTVAYFPEFPSDRLYVAWETEPVILYRSRESGVWSGYLGVSDSYSSPARNPFMEAYGDKAFCVWRGPNTPGGEPGDIWRGRRRISDLSSSWYLKNQSESPYRASEYPVQTGRFASFWQEHVSGDNWDIWYRWENEPPEPFYQSPNPASYPHAVVHYHDNCYYSNAVWTERLADEVYEVRFIRVPRIPTDTDPFYAVATGEPDPSPYCLHRDSTLVYRHTRADFGYRQLRYQLPFLHPSDRYSVWLSLANPGREPADLTISADGILLAKARVLADATISGWLDLPDRLHYDDAMVALELRTSGSGIALTELKVSELDRRPKGGGIQSANRTGRTPELGLHAGPSIAGGRIELSLALTEPARVRLSIYDNAGREQRRVYDGSIEPGRQAWTWDGTDGNGRGLPAGVYFCRADAEGVTATVRLVLVR